PSRVEPGELRVAAYEVRAGGGKSAEVEAREGSASRRTVGATEMPPYLPDQIGETFLSLGLRDPRERTPVSRPPADGGEPRHPPPVARAHEHRNDEEPCGPTSLQQSRDLFAQNELRSQGSGRDEEHCRRGALHRLLNLRPPVPAERDLLVVPHFEHTL